ncbi:MAG: NifU N-terminal domain-containing protein [Phycisphaerales bacterium]
MPARIVRFETTPNPNALKCVADRTLSEKARSYARAPETGTDALAEALFALEGVTNVLILHDWLTVNRAAGADWKSIKAGVKKAVKAHG